MLRRVVHTSTSSSTISKIRCRSISSLSGRRRVCIRVATPATLQSVTVLVFDEFPDPACPIELVNVQHQNSPYISSLTKGYIQRLDIAKILGPLSSAARPVLLRKHQKTVLQVGCCNLRQAKINPRIGAEQHTRYIILIVQSLLRTPLLGDVYGRIRLFLPVLLVSCYHPYLSPPQYFLFLM